MRAIYGKKLAMTRLFDVDGRFVPVTVLEVEENTVTQLKNKEKDGYQAIQFGAGQKRRPNKAMAGHLAASKAKSAKLYEVKTDQEYKVGDKIGVDIFTEGEKVNATAVSKGKGFQGTVKRHHFNTGPRTHGSNNYRQPGSIGSTFPQRVVKGRRMGGHTGAEQVTTQNLVVFKIDPEKNLMYLRGSIPGAKESLVKIWSRAEKEKSEVSDEA